MIIKEACVPVLLNLMVVGVLKWAQTLSDSITSFFYHLFVNMTNC